MASSLRMLGFCACLAGCAQLDERNLVVGSAEQASPPDLALDVAEAPADDLAHGCDVGDVVVNELQTQGANGATDEFVELLNTCTGPAQMDGASVVYRSAQGTSDNFTFYLFGSQSLAGHARFVIANTAFPGAADAKPFASGGGMAATGGGVALRDGAGAVVDSVGWGTATSLFVEGRVVAAPGTSQSAARRPDGTDTNDNEADFRVGAPTPGAAN